jgi:hypothetical protein
MSRVLIVLVLAGAAMSLLNRGGEATAASRASIDIAPAAGDLGELVLVTTRDWPKGLATFSVCGNAARRGSQDCELRNAYVVNVPTNGMLQVRLPLVAPPVPCPCVVRVATTDNALAVTMPVDIRGVPVSDVPLSPTVSTSADSVVVETRLVEPRQAWPASWAAPFAGPVHRRLVVTVENRSEAPTAPLKVVAGVGRDIDDGEALPTRVIGVLDPGTTRTVSIPVDVGAPTWGDYVVFGRVFGLDAPLTFHEEFDTDLWGLELVLPMLLLVVAQVVRHRRRRARRATAARTATADVAVPLANCSPDVGVGAAERYRTSPYHPSEPEHGEPPRVQANGNGHSEGDRMTATRTAQ